MTKNTKHFSSRDEFIQQYLTDALNGVENNFDFEGFADALIDADLLVWDGGHFAFEDASEGEDFDTFWALVEKFDAAAMADH